MFCKTIRIKCITPNAVKRNALFLTMRRARKCANYIVQEAFNKKLLNATAINNATYQNCTRYNLPTDWYKQHETSSGGTSDGNLGILIRFRTGTIFPR